MSDTKRAASVRNVRHLVWNGENVTRVAPLVLEKGAPRLRVTPNTAGFRGALGEANLGPLPVGRRGDGARCGSAPRPTAAQYPRTTTTPSVEVFSSGVCRSVHKAALAESGGAARRFDHQLRKGCHRPVRSSSSPEPEAMPPVQVPVLGVGHRRCPNLLIAAGSSASLTLDAEAARSVRP